MFTSSQDILNLAKTIGVAAFTLMFVWLFYYIVQIARHMFKMVKEMRERINQVDEVIGKIKEKIEFSTSYLVLISEGVKRLVEMYKGRDEKKEDKKKAKKNKY